MDKLRMLSVKGLEMQSFIEVDVTGVYANFVSKTSDEKM